jgi:hypothetical protein
MCGAISNVRFTPDSDRETRHPQKVMSALPLKADMCGANRHVCFGPIADIATSLDHCIGKRKQVGWKSDAKCFRGLEVDD